LNKELSELRKQQDLATTTEGWNRLQEAIDGVTKKINSIKGKEEEIDLDELFPIQQESVASKTIGENMVDGIMAGIAGRIQDADTNTLKSLLQVVLENGIEGIDIPTDKLMEKIIGDGADIPDEYWQNLEDKINEKLKELGIEPIKIDFTTGNVSKVAKETEKSWKQAAQAVSSIGDAFNAIEDPSAKAAGMVMQAIASIALGFAQAAAAKDTTASGWAWLGWLAAGAAAMATTISTIHSLTGFENGGEIKGNSYSGDNIPIMANAGEVVLTRAMAGNLASQLEGAATNVHVTGEVHGTKLVLVMNRALKVAGKGEIVTWK
jgi:hypothetical protein